MAAKKKAANAKRPVNSGFEKERANLLVRLYSGDSVQDPVSWMSPVQGLLAVLQSFGKPLPKATADAWGKPVDELVAIGLANVKAQAEHRIEPKDAGGGRTITAVWGRNAYFASMVLRLDDFLGEAKLGAFVTVPFNGAILFHKITGLDSRHVITPLLQSSHHLMKGADPLSPELYWWHAGRLHHLPSKDHGNVISWTATAEFSKVVVDGK